MTLTSTPFVSIIIPVFNDAKHLSLCLVSLEHQTYPKSFYEVIVVDNGSDSDENIQEIVDRSKSILISELTPGSYAARNKGISAAQGEVIAFTDADCVPTPNWIEKGVGALLNTPNCGLVAGRIEIFFKHSQPTPVELYESITAFPQKQLLERRHYAAAANIFTFKAVLEKIGLFDATLKSNGDVEWGQRVFSHGYQQIYTNEACVYHPARYSFQQLYKRTIRLAGGVYDLQNRRNPSSLKRNLVFLRELILDFIPPLMFTFNAFRDPRLKGIRQNWKFQ